MPQFTSKPRVRELFKQTYKSLMSWVSQDKIPDSLPFLNEGSVIKHVNMKAIGRVEINGVEMEFADVRIYVLPP